MSLKSWLRNKLAEFILGEAESSELPVQVLVDKVDPAPDDAPLLGPEAERMLATSKEARHVHQPAPPLEGSAEERLARLRLR